METKTDNNLNHVCFHLIRLDFFKTHKTKVLDSLPKEKWSFGHCQTDVPDKTQIAYEVEDL